MYGLWRQGVRRCAPQIRDALKLQFLKLQRKYHPDKNGHTDVVNEHDGHSYVTVFYKLVADQLLITGGGEVFTEVFQYLMEQWENVSAGESPELY